MHGVSARVLVVVAVSLLGPFASCALVRAEPTIPACPEVIDGADAAQQVACWTALQSRSDPRCGSGACDHAITEWCKTAALDVPEVGHACFLAQIRTGDFAAAVASSEYLQAPTAPVVRCQSALETPVDLRIVSNPPGATVQVDGVTYGSAPIVARLRTPWWERKIAALFGAMGSAATVEVTDEQLRAAFDTRACAMADLVVNGPAPRVGERALTTGHSATSPRAGAQAMLVESAALDASVKLDVLADRDWVRAPLLLRMTTHGDTARWAGCQHLELLIDGESSSFPVTYSSTTLGRTVQEGIEASSDQALLARISKARQVDVVLCDARWKLKDGVRAAMKALAARLERSPRYTSDATMAFVSSTKTALTWQRDVEMRSVTQSEASTYCSGLTLAGGGWRLPTREELTSIVDLRNSPTIARSVFPNTLAGCFWSSSSYTGARDRAWLVNFADGYASFDTVLKPCRVRCVRTGSPSP
jgi:Protein of unknown function (DUF1566)/PEGA domain